MMTTHLPQLGVLLLITGAAAGALDKGRHAAVDIGSDGSVGLLPLSPRSMVRQPAMVDASSGSLSEPPSQATPQQRADQKDFGDLNWALVIDGKDAKNGRDVFKGIDFDKVLNDGLPFVLGSHGVEEQLTLEHAEDIHKHCCKWPYRRKHSRPLCFLAACFKDMDCESQLRAISDVPDDLLEITWADKEADGKRCPEIVQSRAAREDTTARTILRRLIGEYNESLAKLGSFASEALKLKALATFLRNIAWGHVFDDGNGRFRTLLLQHEVRRLGLGLGAFMFNNNRDVFFNDADTYTSKIQEGLDMAHIAIQTNTNPWLDDQNVQKHLETFISLAGGKCHQADDKGFMLRDHTVLSTS